MNNTAERRKFWRAAFHAPARLTGSGHGVPVEVLDLSLKGALVGVPAQWTGSPGDAFELELELADDASIRMHARLVHVEAGHAGLRCEHIDIDSITHLRRLVELNLGDPGQLERELAQLSA